MLKQNKKILLFSLLVLCLIFPFKLDAAMPSQITVNKGSLVGPITTNLGDGVVKQDSFSTSTGGAAYCLQPGKDFAANGSMSSVYTLSSSFDVTKCKKGDKSYVCGLAQIIYEGGGDYLSTLTALRLWTIKSGKGGGNSTSDEQMTDNRKVLGAVVDRIDRGQSFNFNGGEGALNIYKKVLSGGFQMDVPQIEYKTHEYLNETKQATIYFDTGLSDGKRLELTDVKELNYSLPVRSYSLATCPNEPGKQCIKVDLDLSSQEVKSSIKVKVSIKYKDESGIISNVGYYVNNGNPSRYQDMFIYESGANHEVTKDIEVPIDSKNCQVSTDANGVRHYYGKNGNEVDVTTYTIECGNCARVNGKCYYNGNEVDCSSSEWIDNCGETCPEKPIDTVSGADCVVDGTDQVVADPEICGILKNGDNNYMMSYHNDYCHIFCREELHFKFMDKDTAIAGRYFKNNVQAKHSTLENLSVSIIGQKQCTSLIDYDKWKDAYENINESILGSWNSLKMWEAYYSTSGDGSPTKREEGGGTSETCKGNECEHPDVKDHDLYWGADDSYVDWCGVDNEGNPQCHYHDGTSNSGKDAKCPKEDCDRCKVKNPDGTDKIGSNGRVEYEDCNCKCVGTSEEATAGDEDYVINGHKSAVGGYGTLIRLREDLLRDIQNCNFMSSNGAYGTEKVSYDSGEFNTHFRSMYADDVNYKPYPSFWRNVIDYNLDNELDIDYEENYTFNQNYDIEIANELNDSYLKVVRKGYSKSDYNGACSNCEDDLDSIGSDTNLTPFDYWNCNGSLTGAKCDKKTIYIPENKTANIVVERETNHYQNAELYSQILTGKVEANGGGEGWLELDKHIYPVSINRKEGDYDIEVTFGHLGDSNRPNTMQFKVDTFTCKYNVIIGGIPVTPECAEPPCGAIGLYFRTIELSNVFPNSTFDSKSSGVSNRKIGFNWTTENAIKVIRNIQNKADDAYNTGVGNDIWVSDVKPQYKFTLNSRMLADIKKYNQGITYGDDSVTINCHGLNCTSDFLTGYLKDYVMKDKYNLYYVKDTSIRSGSLYNYNYPARSDS